MNPYDLATSRTAVEEQARSDVADIDRFLATEPPGPARARMLAQRAGYLDLAHPAQPDASRPIFNRFGRLCPRATASDYPLTGRCSCGDPIGCADGTADWTHRVALCGDCGGRYVVSALGSGFNTPVLVHADPADWQDRPHDVVPVR